MSQDLKIEEFQQDSLIDEREKPVPPKRYNVVLYNDDYTTTEFVVMVLETIFRHSNEEAIRIMLQIHHHGMGIAGLFSKEIAETKMFETIRLARQFEYPLQCTIKLEE